jgi:multiple sugar transport system substrate-binding protein
MRRILQISLAVLFLTQASFAATTITWWQFWTDPGIKPVIKAMVDEFEKANPDIKVELTDLTWSNGHEKIVIAYSSGTAPDVIELGSDWIAQFAANGHLADLSESVATDSGEYHGWSLATYKDRLYARPWFLGTRVLFANRDLLKRAGYENDFMPYKLSDLKVAARKVHLLGKDIYGWGSNAPEKHRLYKKFLPFMWSEGGQIFSDDGRMCVLPSVHTVSALTIYKELHDSSGYVSNQRGIEDAFLDGKVGFIISGDWLLKRIELEKRKINLATALIPGPKFPGKSFLGGEFLAVSESCEHKDEAMRFVAFITSPENQIRFCQTNRSATPSSKTAQQDPYFSSTEPLKIFNKQILSVKHPPVDPDWVVIEDIIEKAVEDALFGSGLIAEPLRQAQMKIEHLKNK